MKELTVKAKDNHGHAYDVIIVDSPVTGKPVLRILGTPGSWYLETLAKHRHFILSLDFGQNWDCVNFDEILTELNTLGFIQ